MSGVVLASVLTTVSSVYPAFLAGALGGELRDALGLSETAFGFVIGSFFVGSTLGSIALGRLTQRIGARRMITATLLTSAMSCLAIAGAVRSMWPMILALVVAGVANAGGQTAANQLLGQSVDPERLGFAMAVKQSGMPSASLLGGLAVPVIALTVGWQWGYVAAAVLAVTSLSIVLRFAPSERSSSAPSTSTPPTGRPRVVGPLSTPRRTITLAAVSAGFASAAAGTLGNWTTSSATDAGWSPGAAGLLLSLGSIAGIASRLVLGWRADRTSRSPVTTAAAVLALGAIGAILLAPRNSGSQLVAVVLAFGAGWAWPALFNFGVVRANPGAAGPATGITQTGVYVGVFSGPVLMGWLVDHWGYETGWLAIATSMLIGATIMFRVAPALEAGSQHGGLGLDHDTRRTGSTHR